MRESGLFRLEKREWGMIVLQTAAIDVMLSETFFRASYGYFISLPAAVFGGFYAVRMARQKKRDMLKRQFRDLMVAVTSSMQAGYAFMNAIQDAVSVVKEMYGETCIVSEIMKPVLEGNEMNLPLDQLIADLARKCELKEVRDFSEVVIITRRYGGNLPGMLKELSVIIEDEMEIRKAILSATAQARYEAYIMDLIPVGIIWYLNLTGGGFLESLYNSLFGLVFMTACMFVYCAIVLWQFYMMERAIQ